MAEKKDFSFSEALENIFQEYLPGQLLRSIWWKWLDYKETLENWSEISE